MAGVRPPLADDFDLVWRARNIKLRNENNPDMQRHYRRENILHLMHEFNMFKQGKIDLPAYNFLLEKEYNEMPLPTSLLNEEQKNKLQKMLDNLSPQNTTEKFGTSKQVQTAQKSIDSMTTMIQRELEEFKGVPLFVNKQPPSVRSNTATPWNNRPSTTKQPLNNYARSRNDRQTATKRKQEDQENDVDMSHIPSKTSDFRSAREQLIRNQKKKNQQSSSSEHSSGVSVKKSLGARPRVPGKNKFVPPSSNNEQERSSGPSRMASSHNGQHGTNNVQMEEEIDPRLQGIDPKIIEMISNEIMLVGNKVEWDDIAGLEFVKQMIEEIIIWPMQRPDLFTGLTKPAKGILLFGPPGTGKTLIGKCIANQSGATFFSISASSLTSKWIGEGEKMVRGLFAVAGCHQPAVIFIDEIDSLLTQRSDTEHESSRRMKTEFLVQLDGATTDSDDQILVIGATNRPQELDEAARRRLEKRLYIPLPDGKARRQIVQRLLGKHRHSLTHNDLERIVSLTDGYSGADMTCLCKESAMCPLRCFRTIGVQSISTDDVRPIRLDDFEQSVKRVRPTVSQEGVHFYEEWNKQFGCSDL